MENAVLVVVGPRGNKVKAQLVGASIILYTKLGGRVNMAVYCFDQEWDAIGAFNRLEGQALIDVQEH